MNGTKSAGEKLSVGSVVCLFTRNGLVEVTGRERRDSEDARLGEYEGVLRHRLGSDGDRVYFDGRDVEQVVVRA
ncbi:MAG: hypothetical protein LKI25_07935 [Atopobiaceae bacterium]|jgi:hypothetical protein|nr:hypothetical protein [Atopobiaceae bacterium]MCI2174115.1 hypothetical protein [Atopobiaceae bacterium]MCI2206756.1 hypothetical protein [Atopobiaceae bacterium]